MFAKEDFTHVTKTRDPWRPSGLMVTESCSLAQVPRISVLSAGEFSRPAVIGYVGSSVAHCSPAAIKEILNSVLNTSDGIQLPCITQANALCTSTEDEDSDMECWLNISSDDPSEDHLDSDDESSHDDSEHQTDNTAVMDIQCGVTKGNCIRLQVLDHPPLEPQSFKNCPTVSFLEGLFGEHLLSSACHRTSELVLPSDSTISQMDSYSKGSESRHRSSTVPDALSTPQKLGGNSFSSINSFWTRGVSLSFTNLSATEVNANSLSTGSTESSSTDCSSQELFRASTDLDKENAHFIVADIIMAALENMKCNIRSQQSEPWRPDYYCGSHNSHQAEVEISCLPTIKKHSKSTVSWDSGYGGNCSMSRKDSCLNIFTRSLG
nr:PREDICTED: uncharacterized protein KIAA0226-like [Latimeria chalumnae]|eukprot:XP_014351065.1 PREDICTED: uncharacterized protein KIAA0226-like [Latimeria chalumnae]